MPGRYLSGGLVASPAHAYAFRATCMSDSNHRHTVATRGRHATGPSEGLAASPAAELDRPHNRACSSTPVLIRLRLNQRPKYLDYQMNAARSFEVRSAR